MTASPISTSGTSELPDVLPYAKFLPRNEGTRLFGRMCYVIKKYERAGLAVLICTKDGITSVQAGDFDGHKIDAHVLAEIPDQLSKILRVMQVIQIYQAQFYFAGVDRVLVDVRTHYDKYIGPGMLRDLFGNILSVQEVVATIPLGQTSFDSMGDDLIIKPSRFMTNEARQPLYIDAK